jgi:hypothetical protein
MKLPEGLIAKVLEALAPAALESGAAVCLACKTTVASRLVMSGRQEATSTSFNWDAS